MYYAPNNLYKKYIERSYHEEFSSDLPETTRKTTLMGINYAINLCENWNNATDIGAGFGHYLAALSAQFKNNVGIEIDNLPEHTKLSEKFTNITFFHDVVEKYPKHEKFDFVLLMDIFEHIPDLESFIGTVSHLQNKGGVVYIVTPNPIFCGPASESEIYFKKTDYHGHIKHYTKKEVVEIMQRFGYMEEFSFYEEAPLRQRIKLVLKAVSRRDKRWSRLLRYQIIRPFVMLVLKPIFFILQEVSVYSEKKYRNDPYNTISLSIAFKKS